MKLKVVRIEYVTRILVAKNFHIDNLILQYSEKLLLTHDTRFRFRFIEWAAKIGTKTECAVCICNIYIYIYIYIYILYYIYIYITIIIYILGEINNSNRYIIKISLYFSYTFQ